jgi:hypothetical protein
VYFVVSLNFLFLVSFAVLLTGQLCVFVYMYNHTTTTSGFCSSTSHFCLGTVRGCSCTLAPESTFIEGGRSYGWQCFFFPIL